MRKKIILWVLALFIVVMPALAEIYHSNFSLYDDFESYPVANFNNQSNWYFSIMIGTSEIIDIDGSQRLRLYSPGTQEERVYMNFSSMPPNNWTLIYDVKMYPQTSPESQLYILYGAKSAGKIPVFIWHNSTGGNFGNCNFSIPGISTARVNITKIATQMFLRINNTLVCNISVSDSYTKPWQPDFWNGNFQESFLDNVYATIIIGNCSDSVQNGDETGIDCGGSCAACYTPPVEAPDVNITYVNGVPFVNNTIVESGNVTINVSCTNETVVISHINVSFSNGTLADWANGSSIIIPNENLPIDDNYTIRLYCEDKDGDGNKTSGVFQLLDTTFPTATYTNPKQDNTTKITVNNTLLIQAVFSDTNLFGFNYSCNHTTQGTIFEESIIGITGTQYNMSNVTGVLDTTGNVTCNIEVCDDHTITTFSPITYDINDEEKSIVVNGKNIIEDKSMYNISSIEITKKQDRISYCYTYNTKDAFLVLRYKLEKNQGWLLRNITTGHFASWQEKEWADFATKSDFLISDISETNQSIYITAGSHDKKVCFDSVGGLNCRNDVIRFEIIPAPEIPEEEPSPIDSLSLSRTMILLTFILLGISLLVIGMFTGIMGFGFMGLLFIMIFFLYFLEVDALISAVIMFIALISFFWILGQEK